MRKIILLSIFCWSCVIGLQAQPQTGGEIRITVESAEKQAVAFASASLLRPDSSIAQTLITDSLGRAAFTNLAPASYILKVSSINFETHHSALIDLSSRPEFQTVITLQPAAGLIGNVTVTAKKPLVQFMPDKTVINVEAGITNAGATVMEVLEKSPGVTVDRDGNVSLKGRSNVQVMIDGKLTQLSGSDLQNLLTGMNATQVETIELMDNPPAKYDAAGNSGIINIRLKKVKQKGFNGTLTVALGHGKRYKNNNSLILNYRSGDWNYFFNYSVNANKYLMDLWAIRTNYNANGTIGSVLEQPYNTLGTGVTHNLRTGVDYSMSRKTTVGFAFTGTYLTRNNSGRANASWKNAAGVTDSTIVTTSNSSSRLKQGGLNVNMRHSFNSKEELAADVDLIGYDIYNDQQFENLSSVAGSKPDASRGSIPSDIKIFSAKADYSKQFRSVLWEAGWKTSRVNTDNFARYEFLDGNVWKDDLGKSNHFLYKEDIHALYSSFNLKSGRWSTQGGLRYEYTSYKAKQLGNAVVKDSSFNRRYHSLFPTLFVSYEADSINTFTFRAGRRIDRPGFQKLNPFVFIINKYTFQQGNPYFLPQYTWNTEISHQYKDILSTGVSYSITNDYFSQIFLTNPDGTIVYTEGNVGKMRNLGVSMSIQLPVASWWSLSGQAVFNRKMIEGTLWKEYKATINQGTFSMNNQFRFKKGWSAELSGFLVTRAQNDLQEVLDPTGQLAAGVSKQVLKNKGTLRLVVRDIFYTQAMAGWSYFEKSIEYFKLMRDTRVATLSFTWRFGKTMKQMKRSSGSAQELIERAGSVN
ncbi:outer membrane beta-barrel family protein [Terrimonas sp. NA20]|uniref:Outer membrane beta-barrel family protein n=1 Tax=Terrimonas ginsenosidimutans TaxID=2908004 RepID=A0ABS9KZA0_9BACT|nr:outer membrane beta-barrel family protein [Terrimonas ginsenosidimutans]MCG2617552.1 outer membrane beta-barrel family protein [Terrimonas ginsenosidimutans]